MLMTEMWHRGERSRHFYKPETPTRANDNDPFGWEKPQHAGRQSRISDVAPSTSRSDKAMADGAYWQSRQSDSRLRIASSPPHLRGKSSPRPSRGGKIQRYYESAVTEKTHYNPHKFTPVDREDAGWIIGSADPSSSIISESRIRNKQDMPISGGHILARDGMTGRQRLPPETVRSNEHVHMGDGRSTENSEKRRELPHLRPITDHFEVQDPSTSKGRFRVDLDKSTVGSESSLRAEEMSISSSKSYLPYSEVDETFSRYESHKPYPRRYSSAMDDTPVMVHRYDKSRDYSQSKHYSNPRYSDEHGNRKVRHSLDDSYRHGYRPSSPRLSTGGKVQRERPSDSSASLSIPYPMGTKKELPSAAASSTSVGGKTTADRHPFESATSPTSLPPLTPTSSCTTASTSLTQDPRDVPLPTNESTQSSTASATDNSRPSSPPKVRAPLARSHVPKKHSSKDLCVICGDKASGYHYNTLSCEGCKGFFRRTVTRNLHYQCKYGGNCVMDMWMRRKCPACRVKRCRQVGMREECLLTEYQCVIRNSRRKMKVKKKKETEPSTLDQAKEDDTISPDDTQAILASLNSDHRDLIERLVNLQDKYELPSPEDLNLLREDKIYEAPNQDDLSDAIFVHMVEMTILVTRLIVEFAKNLPGFRNLAKEDQIVLLKSSSSEVMMLRTARRYNAETNTIVFGNGVPFSPKDMAFGGLQESVESLFNFSKSMSGLYVDNAEYALMTAMCIFSVRSGLTNPSVVDKLQEVYMEVLLSYVSKRRSRCPNFLAKLLMKFVHLRTLGHEHSQTLYNLTLKKGNLPPLLTEYFDISE